MWDIVTFRNWTWSLSQNVSQPPRSASTLFLHPTVQLRAVFCIDLIPRIT